MSDTAARLRAAAFGNDVNPGEAVFAAASAGGPRQRWLAAVVLGARGHYARAAALLEPLAVHPVHPVVSSLAASALASHRRQLGGHRDARVWDARALRRLAGARGAGAPEPDGVDFGGALADALLGLAADALACGRQREARLLIDRVTAGDGLGMSCLSSWRARVRHGWVGAEVELAAGDFPAAIVPAERAAALAREYGGLRHVLKSDIVLAAALSAARLDLDRAASLATHALDATAKAELASLEWPAAVVAAGLDPQGGAAKRQRATEILHAVLLRSDPLGRLRARNSPWVPINPNPCSTHPCEAACGHLGEET